MTYPRPKGKQPEYHIHALNKRTGEKGKIGAMWVNENGRSSFSIRFDPFITVPNDDPDVVITVFVNDRSPDPPSKEG